MQVRLQHLWRRRCGSFATNSFLQASTRPTKASKSNESMSLYCVSSGARDQRPSDRSGPAMQSPGRTQSTFFALALHVEAHLRFASASIARRGSSPRRAVGGGPLRERRGLGNAIRRTVAVVHPPGRHDLTTHVTHDWLTRAVPSCLHDVAGWHILRLPRKRQGARPPRLRGHLGRQAHGRLAISLSSPEAACCSRTIRT